MKDAALVKAGRCISVIAKASTIKTDCYREKQRVIFNTPFTADERDIMTGQIPDALIAINGTAGTMAEVACALIGNSPVPVVFLGQAGREPKDLDEQQWDRFKNIKRKLDEKWGNVGDLEKILGEQLELCPPHTTAQSAVDEALRKGAARAGRWQWAGAQPLADAATRALFAKLMIEMTQLCTEP